MAEIISPREEITPENYGPIVSIVTWLLLISAALSVCAKVAIKVVTSHSFDADDVVLVAAMVSISIHIFDVLRRLLCQVISVSQSISFSVQVKNGVGKHLIGLTDSQKMSYQKVCSAAPRQVVESIDTMTGWLLR